MLDEILMAISSMLTRSGLRAPLNIEWRFEPPSPLHLGTTCTWRCGTTWPASGPSLIPIVSELAPSALEIALETFRSVLERAQASSSLSSWNLCTCLRGTTRVCPSASG